MTVPVPELRGDGQSVPRALESLIHRLLKKDPRDRYQSAEAALADLEAIAEGMRSRRPRSGGGDRRQRQTADVDRALVCRPQRASADARHAGRRSSSRRRRPGADGERVGWRQNAAAGGSGPPRGAARVLGAARPGHQRRGPTAVSPARRHRRRSAGRGPLARGHGGNAAGSVEPNIATRSQRHLPATAALFEQDSEDDAPPEETGEARTIQALAVFLDVLGTADRPAMIILDDCQWADELTYKLIRRWQTDGGDARRLKRNVLVVAAFRAEEVAADNLLRKIDGVTALAIAAFDACRGAAAGRVDGRPVARHGHRNDRAAGRGQPVHGVGRAARICRKRRAVSATDDGWGVEPAAIADAGSSSRAGSFLARRLELLPADTIELLSTGAVLGKEFDLQMAIRCSRAIDRQGDRGARRSPAAPTSSGCDPTARSAFSCTTRSASAALDRMDVGSATVAASPGGQLLAGTSRRTASRNWPTISTRPATAKRRFPMRSRRPSRPARSMPWKSPSSNIAIALARRQDRDGCGFAIVEGLGDALMLRGRYDSAGELFESAAAARRRSLCQSRNSRQARRAGLQAAATCPRPSTTFRSACDCWADSCRDSDWLGGVLLSCGKASCRCLHTAVAELFVHRVPPAAQRRRALGLAAVEQSLPTAAGTRAAR